MAWSIYRYYRYWYPCSLLLLSLSHSCNQEPPASPVPGATSRVSDVENSMTPPEAGTSSIGAAEYRYEQASAAQPLAVVRAGGVRVLPVPT